MKKTHFKKTGGDFIDPEDCGSFIRYAFTVTEHTASKGSTPYVGDSFSMSLGDCSRVISWSFDDMESGVNKLDLCIKIMQKARTDLVVGQMIAKVTRARVERLAEAHRKAKKK